MQYTASPTTSFVSLLPRPLRLAALAALITGVAACSSKPPQAEVAVGRASVDRATGAAAAEAPMELARARDKIARANVAMANKDYAQARRLAEEADADAQLAEAKARATRSEQALAEVRASIRQLREQADLPARP